MNHNKITKNKSEFLESFNTLLYDFIHDYSKINFQSCFVEGFTGIICSKTNTYFTKKDIKTVIKKAMSSYEQPVTYSTISENCTITSTSTAQINEVIKLKGEDIELPDLINLYASVIYTGGSFKLAFIQITPISSMELKMLTNELAPYVSDQYESIIDNIPGAMIIASEQSNYPIRVVNSQVVSLLGYSSKKELLDACDALMVNVIVPENREAVRTLINNYKENDCTEESVKLLKKDGTAICVMCKAIRNKIKNNKDIIVLSFLDISKRDNEGRLQNKKVQDVPGGICSFEDDKGLTVRYANPAFYNVVGHNKNEFNSKLGNKFLNCLTSESRYNVLVAISDAKSGNSPTFEIEEKVITAESKTKYFLLRGSFSEEEGKRTIDAVIIDITKTRKKHSQLERSHERLKIAMSYVECTFFELDITTKELVYSVVVGDGTEEKYKWSNFPDSLLNSGDIHPKSQKNILAAMNQVYNGEDKVSCEIMLRDYQGNFNWQEVKALVIKENGKPVWAVGVVKDINREKKAEQTLKREEQYRKLIAANAIISFEFDLSKDKMDSLIDRWSGDANAIRKTSYTNFQLDIVNKYMHPYDKKVYLATFSSKNLIKSYHQGDKSINMEFRLINNEGMWTWVKTTMYLTQDTTTNDIKGFAYIENIDTDKKKDLQLEYKSQRDGLTNLYNKVVTQELITKYLSLPHKNCALYIIDIDNFKKINDKYGHLVGDDVIGELGKRLKENFKNNTIVGRVGGDEFLLFVKDCQNLTSLSDIGNMICSMFPSISDEKELEVTITCSVGICLSTDETDTFTQIFKRADEALYKSKVKGKNTYTFYHSPVEKGNRKNDKKLLSKELKRIKTKFHQWGNEKTQTISDEKRKRSGRTLRRILYAGAICSLTVMLILTFHIGFFKNMKDDSAQTNLQIISDNKSISFLSYLESCESSVIDISNILYSKYYKDSYEFLTENELFSNKSIRHIALISPSHEWTYRRAPNGVIMSDKGEEEFMDFNGRKLIFNEKDNTLIFIISSVVNFSSGEKFNYYAISFDADNARQYLCKDMGEQPYINVIFDRDGKVVSYAGDKNIVSYSSGDMFFDSIYNTFSKRVADGIKRSTSINEQFSAQVNINSVSYYIMCKPVRDNSMYLFTAIPKDSKLLKNNRFFTSSFLYYAISIIATVIILVIVLCTDIKKSQKLEQLAYRDEITGGYNKNIFISRARRLINTKKDYIVVVADVAKFRLINDFYGNEKANELLRLIYNCMSRNLNEKEILTRLQNDKFVILMQYNTVNQVNERINQIKNTVNENVRSLLDEYSLDIDFGAYIPAHGEKDVNAMLTYADTAKNYQRKHGVKELEIYNDTIRKNIVRRKELENRMTTALEKDYFQIYLQPKYELRTGLIESAEVLTRWIDPKSGVIMPNEYIPIFENNGFITKFDLFIFEKVCACLKERIDQGFIPLPVSINFSRANLNISDPISKYKSIMDKYEISGKYIEFELTETLICEDFLAMSKIVEEIHSLGSKCSIDDFGKGFSSLNVLKNLPVDTLKIDKEFFNEKGEIDTKTRSIIKTIITLSQELGLHTVAEGVTRTDQVDFLKEIGCDMVQGFIFAKPMPVSEYQRLLDEQKSKGNNTL